MTSFLFYFSVIKTSDYLLISHGLHVETITSLSHP